MKIRIGSGLLPLNLLVIALILIIAFSPSSSPYDVFHIILGLPLALLFPGYALIAALFPKKEGLDNTERMALSFLLSVAILSLIGLILNFTPLGIRPEPVLYSVSGFTFAISMVAIWRRARIPEEDRFNFTSGSKIPGWDGGFLGKFLAILVMVSILGSLGMLGYYIASPAVEPFTEFYILDVNGGYKNYPTEISSGDEAEVILGIVNKEQDRISYRIEITVDGTKYNETGPILLENNEKWEDLIGFSITKAGNEQKVEFLLFKDGQSKAYRSIHLWINVR